MSVLERELVAYEKRRKELERNHNGEWVVFYKDDFVGVFADFEAAGNEALDRFDTGPYLIRQIGVEEIQLSSTAVFRFANASTSGI